MKSSVLPRHGQPLFQAGTGTEFAVTTPEGVPLRFRIASAGARAGAMLIDYGIIFLAILLISIVLGASGVVLESGMLLALMMVMTFLTLHFYFTFFEVRWQGATPGKRVAGIRVINRLGGPVTGDAILTRNFLRIVEVFVPLQMMSLAGSDGFRDVPWYLVLLGTAWAFLLTFLPLFNRQRMRLGDIAAGTVVVQMPKSMLLGDLGEEGERKRRGRASVYQFTRKQLGVYGEYELQVLEELLRSTNQPNRAETMRLVTEKITRKIDYPREISRRQTGAFLQAFYEALRAHRERRMLFGKRKQDKHAKED